MDTLGAQGRFSARCVFKFLSFVLALGAVSLGTQRAFAYPWMIKHGYGGCPTCHADPSGGELLTPYGRLQGDLMLRMHYAADQETPSQAAGFLWGLYQPPAWLLLGGSYRHMTILEGARPPPPSSPSRPSKPTLSTFPMQADLYAQARLGAFRGAASLGLAEVGPDSPHARAAQITSAPAYRLNLVSRTHWIGWDFGEQYTLRAGRLNLPFGVRIPEHTAWVRDYTRTDRESDQQHGIAVAYNGDSARGEIMLILGNYQVRPDRFRERGYSLYIEGRLADDQRIGVSSLITRALTDRITLEQDEMVRQAHGIFARLTLFRPAVLLAEADILLRSRHDAGYVGWAQLDYEPVQGLHILTTGELLDAGLVLTDLGIPPHVDSSGTLVKLRAPGFGEPRFGAWFGLDWFFFYHLEARVDLVLRQNDPLAVLAQLHAYL